MPASGLQPLGAHLRRWRLHRRLSQLDLAGDAAISTRHLSCLETGRAQPSREMVLRLAERLHVPLRERNAWLVAAGYAPMYRERPLDDPSMAAAREAIELILRGHEPFPALALDRHWQIVAANRSVHALIEGAAAHLLVPPINVARLSLHPQGLAPRIVNFGTWREHLLMRLHQQFEATGDPALASLRSELLAYPTSGEEDAGSGARAPYGSVAVPLQLRTASGTLAFISTTTVFGSPVDITLQELALETFFPADSATAEALRQLA
ncbi:helix-turn-helix transcriptional regulator [Ramlibacter sp. AN1015]|uniref:helix-turn-helix transcriptional regulator n=1 Tax=Ramlibacter sp. AN1015 TaxID=3133428 RepID=UPI0030C20A16